MLIAAIVLFAIAALAGFTMAAIHFRSRTTPRALLAGFHGLFAASGLIVLILAVMKASSTPAQASLGILLLAALGGFTLVSFHVRGRRLPDGLVVGHALLGIAGFATLIAAVWLFVP